MVEVMPKQEKKESAPRLRDVNPEIVRVPDYHGLFIPNLDTYPTRERTILENLIVQFMKELFAKKVTLTGQRKIKYLNCTECGDSYRAELKQVTGKLCHDCYFDLEARKRGVTMHPDMSIVTQEMPSFTRPMSDHYSDAQNGIELGVRKEEDVEDILREIVPQ